jgi:hypothetical protein
VNALDRRIRALILLFMAGLVLSGLTAFPLVSELRILDSYFGTGSAIGRRLPALGSWIATVKAGLSDTDAKYPFILYGTDWLAFAHLVIAIAFWGPLVDPVRNKWVLDFGIIACAGIIPLAMIAGPLRGIPFYWRMIDCSFGIFGCLPLIMAKRYIQRKESLAESLAESPAWGRSA